ncbi:MAG TPA: hypothetical protein VH158_01625 [Gemmatimonadales bacterium]|nr:hypothetical protein [Gemmatimonadales bacterium]
MIPLSTTRGRSTAPLALALLVIQGLAGGAVPLAHASEHFSAPAHVEAHHDAGCLALHDELRCALCQFAGSQVAPELVRSIAVTAPRAARRPPRPRVAPAAGSQHRTAPPRAPPTSRS